MIKTNLNDQSALNNFHYVQGHSPGSVNEILFTREITSRWLPHCSTDPPFSHSSSRFSQKFVFFVYHVKSAQIYYTVFPVVDFAKDVDNVFFDSVFANFVSIYLLI